MERSAHASFDARRPLRKCAPATARRPARALRRSVAMRNASSDARARTADKVVAGARVERASPGGYPGAGAAPATPLWGNASSGRREAMPTCRLHAHGARARCEEPAMSSNTLSSPKPRIPRRDADSDEAFVGRSDLSTSRAHHCALSSERRTDDHGGHLVPVAARIRS